MDKKNNPKNIDKNLFDKYSKDKFDYTYEIDSEKYHLIEHFMIGKENLILSFTPKNNIFIHNLKDYENNSNYVSITRSWHSKINNNVIDIIDNRRDFTELSNLEDILIKSADLMIFSLKSESLIFPYHNFGIRLSDELKENYSGRGELVLCLREFIPQIADYPRFTMNRFAINEYLDLMMGLNYGDFIRKSPELREKLEYINSSLIHEGTRNQERFHKEIKFPFEKIYLTNKFYSSLSRSIKPRENTTEDTFYFFLRNHEF